MNVETTSLLSRIGVSVCGRGWIAVVILGRDAGNTEEVDIGRRLPEGSAGHISFLIVRITRRELIPPAAYTYTCTHGSPHIILRDLRAHVRRAHPFSIPIYIIIITRTSRTLLLLLYTCSVIVIADLTLFHTH